MNDYLHEKKLEELGLSDSDGFKASNNAARDLSYFIYCSWGLYCYSSTLVNRFITYETSRLQQSYMTKLFHEQRDGLVVLKPRTKRVDETNQSSTDLSSRRMFEPSLGG